MSKLSERRKTHAYPNCSVLPHHVSSVCTSGSARKSFTVCLDHSRVVCIDTLWQANETSIEELSTKIPSRGFNPNKHTERHHQKQFLQGGKEESRLQLTKSETIALLTSRSQGEQMENRNGE